MEVYIVMRHDCRTKESEVLNVFSSYEAAARSAERRNTSDTIDMKYRYCWVCKRELLHF